ncbi:MAG: DHHW family protein [Sarcina sp.]
MKYNKVIAIFFILSISVISIASAFIPTKDFSEKENRILAKKPSFSIDRVLDGRYSKKFEKYKTDQIIGRNFLTTIKATTDLAFGKKFNNNVFYSSNDYLIEDFTPMENTKIQNNLSSINKFTQKHSNINSYIAIVPTSFSILSDKLPSFVDTNKQLNYINNFYENVSKKIKTISLDAILKNHQNEYIFYKTDHHWTSLGAYLGFTALEKEMNLQKSKVNYEILPVTNEFNGALSSKSSFRTFNTDTIDIYIPQNTTVQVSINYLDAKKKSSSFYNIEKLDSKDKYGVFLGGNHPIIEIKTTAQTTNSLLLFKDSYANSLIPFLAEHYSKIVVIDPRYYYDDIDILILENDFTDLLYLYNANTFFTDESLSLVLNNQ